ncbi:TIGR00645 family protein [Verrucomicrobium sp. BvORR034]|uniref:TIGR00645 family protein n=1 Tax=Verrucomicrobium sp. BvORR034 TaxID=1396418 RepID=UPI0006785DC6|nr:TIGR00645 family protein [Verrucomicrobium sp. BvORR034]
MTPPSSNGFRTTLSSLIFLSRWLQAPLYLGLILAQGVYVWVFLKELWHLVGHAPVIKEQEIMLIVLGLIDVVMIANLLIMVIIGGYETFVSRLDLDGHPDQPEWLSHVNAGVLKVKLATALIGISSIHLLKSFIDANSKTLHELFWQTCIHFTFLISALVLAWIDKLTSHPAAHGNGVEKGKGNGNGGQMHEADKAGV